MPDDCKLNPQVYCGHPGPTAADTSQFDKITKPVAEDTPPAAAVEPQGVHLDLENLACALPIC